MNMPRPISALQMARQAYHDYLALMRERPWAEGELWIGTVEGVAKAYQEILKDPPDMEAHSKIWAYLDIDRGGKGSRDYSEACPDAEIYASFTEASAWMHAWKRGEVAEGQPLSQQYRREYLNYRECDRVGALRRLMDAKRHPTRVFENSPEGVAEIERALNLPPEIFAQTYGLKRGEVADGESP